MACKRAIVAFGLAGLTLPWSAGCSSSPATPVAQGTGTTQPIGPQSPTPSALVPYIRSISPDATTAGGPNLTITIMGSNFENEPSQVSFVAWSTNSTDTHCCNKWLHTSFVSSTQLTAVVPASLLQSSGTGYLFVETGDPLGDLDGISYPLSNVVPFSVVTSSGFSPTGSMITARMLHSENLLPDGRVLIAGGGSFYPGPPDSDCEDILSLDSAEIYDLIAGVFSSTGKMGTSRFRHTATPLPDGKVLIAGGDETVVTTSGYCSEALSSTELFDPAAGSFSAAAPMHLSRSTHTATLLPDGRVLVAGGENSSFIASSTAEIYDPATGKFSDEVPMTKGHAGHTAVLLPDGEVLLTGGCGPGCVTAELYDPMSNSFHATGDLTTERTGHTATLLPNGKVLITGGRIGPDWRPLPSAEIYDPATRSFSATGSMQFARWDHRATLLPKGSVLITGNDEFEPSSTAELYDPAKGQFTTVLLMNAARGAHTSTLLPNGRVLVAGGLVASAELYP